MPSEADFAWTFPNPADEVCGTADTVIPGGDLLPPGLVDPKKSRFPECKAKDSRMTMVQKQLKTYHEDQDGRLP